MGPNGVDIAILVYDNVKAGRLFFTTDAKEAVKKAETLKATA